ncbi:hypothetical protein HLV35_07465 [Eggerthellaceae bacterium zg-997]|nr:hypothetical protein [Eggerthellaceae bacterium zg-997]
MIGEGMGQGDLERECEATPEHEAFKGRFRPRLTTDDCLTPPEVHAAVLAWAAREYGFDPSDAVRPFWPGGDYERFDYPEGCVVVDNPPFSILARIVRFYLGRAIPFLLYAPHLTALGHARRPGVCLLCAGAEVTYANGACVRTSFATSLEPGTVARSAAGLRAAIDAAQARPPAHPRYSYPPELLRSTDLERMARYGVEFRVPVGHAVRVTRLDSQREAGKEVFGSGLLLSESATRARVAADAAKLRAKEAGRGGARGAVEWALSERERALCREMG